MIKVTNEVEDLSSPRQCNIRIHNHCLYQDYVEVEIDGVRRTFNGNDLIAAIKNAMNTNK